MIDRFTTRIQEYLVAQPRDVIISDFAAAEFASAIGNRRRAGLLSPVEARLAFSAFDEWQGRHAASVAASSVDIYMAEGFLRRLDLTLRTPDAIHIAIALRISAELITFDARMADCARALGVAVAAA